MLSERLRQLRLERGLKQKDLLEALSLSSARYSQYESGKRVPDLVLLMKFADFYEVSIDYLVGRTDNKNLSVYKLPLEDEVVVYEKVGDKLSKDEILKIRELIKQTDQKQ